MDRVSLDLPWPLTSNTYWRRRGHTYFISTRGQNYREIVTKHCHAYSGLFDTDSRLRLTIEAYPPDKRRRDLDNLFKAVLDALQCANALS